MGTSASVRRDLHNARGIIMIMRVLMEEVLCQGMTGSNLVLECLFVRCA
jgi:hypothetical protein